MLAAPAIPAVVVAAAISGAAAIAVAIINACANK